MFKIEKPVLKLNKFISDININKDKKDKNNSKEKELNQESNNKKDHISEEEKLYIENLNANHYDKYYLCNNEKKTDKSIYKIKVDDDLNGKKCYP